MESIGFLCALYVFVASVPPPEKTAADLRMEDYAKRTCYVRYKSCLLKLERRPEQHYNAICGEGAEQRKTLKLKTEVL